MALPWPSHGPPMAFPLPSHGPPLPSPDTFQTSSTQMSTLVVALQCIRFFCSLSETERAAPAGAFAYPKSFCYTAALQLLEAAPVMAMSYLSVVWGVLLDLAVFRLVSLIFQCHASGLFSIQVKKLVWYWSMSLCTPKKKKKKKTPTCVPMNFTRRLTDMPVMRFLSSIICKCIKPLSLLLEHSFT